MLETLGLKDLADELPDFSAYLDTKDWPAEWSVRNYPVGASDRARVSSAMKEAFLTRRAQEWEELFGTAKAPATAQRFSKEWLADPHSLASGLVLRVEDARHGEVRQMGNLAWLSGDEAAVEKTGPTVANLDALLAEAPRASGTTGSGGWLEGLKVLDLTNVIAGPTIGSTLARYGAEVTLVQPVEPSVDPWNTVVFGIHAQRCKESILLNLRSDEGQEVLTKLITTADVITMNGTDEQRDKLGLTPGQLNAINPRLILVQLDAFGNLIQAPFMYDYDGRAPFDEPSGREALGWGPFYHCYEAADQWMFFAAPTERQAALARVPDLADLAEAPSDDVHDALAERFRTQPLLYWQKAFSVGQSTVVSLASLHETRDKALQLESEGDIDLSDATFRVIRHDQQPMGRWCDLVAPNAVRPKSGRISIPGPMPKYGQHTRAILARLGYGGQQIDDLIATGAAGTNWSEKYLPE